MTRCCKTCRWLAVKPDAKGRRVVRRYRVYECKWLMPPVILLPDSITGTLNLRNHKGYMCGHYGTTCPTWEPLKQQKGPEVAPEAV